MKTTLTFLKDFYSPLHKKTFLASDPKNNSIEIEVDSYGVPTESFWYEQVRQDENKSYFQITPLDKSKKAK